MKVTASESLVPQLLPGTCEVLDLDAARQAHASVPPRRARTAGPGAVVVDLGPRLELAMLVASYEMIRAAALEPGDFSVLYAAVSDSLAGPAGQAPPGSWSRWLTDRQLADLIDLRAEMAAEASRPSRVSGPRPAHLRLAAGGWSS